MSSRFPDSLAIYRDRYKDTVESIIESLNKSEKSSYRLHRFAEASSYSLKLGGKHIRPCLCYAATAALDNTSIKLAEFPACAVELIHTYSLIHDDLPAMDDDDMRRGKPSLHKAYDEATAVLAGDGLQAKAFEILATAPGLTSRQRLAMIAVLARAAGPEGMVGGQFIDIQSTNAEISLDQLQIMHSLKTGALIKAALKLGGIAAEADDSQLHALDEFGGCIGLAFQVVDDILDVEGNPEKLGKTPGKDSEANKPTYVKLLGLDGAKAEVHRLLQSALQALDGFGNSANPLRDIAYYIVEREY